MTLGAEVWNLRVIRVPTFVSKEIDFWEEQLDVYNYKMYKTKMVREIVNFLIEISQFVDTVVWKLIFKVEFSLVVDINRLLLLENFEIISQN